MTGDRSHDVEQLIRSLIEPDDPVSWAALPYVWLRRELPSWPGPVEPLETLRHLTLATVGHIAVHGVRSEDGVLVAWSSENQRRTLAPVVERLGAAGRSFQRWHPRMAFRQLPRRTRNAIELSTRVQQRLGARSIVHDRRTVHRNVLKAARASCVNLRSERVLVVATQHDPAVRALLRVASGVQIPSVYVPHAPTAANAAYRDLPVDYAVLRGRRDVATYTAMGADDDGLHVGGAPALARMPGIAPIDWNLPPVYAPSPWPDSVLREQIGLVARAVDGPVIVAPHPRQSPHRLARLIPPSWSVASERTTADVLAGGPWCVLQSSSGVAWESLAYGVPTIELVNSEGGPNYGLIDERFTPFVADHAQGRRAISWARAEAASPSARQRLHDWAVSWCATAGPAAAELAAGVVELALDRGPRGLVLDGWATS